MGLMQLQKWEYVKEVDSIVLDILEFVEGFGRRTINATVAEIGCDERSSKVTSK